MTRATTYRTLDELAREGWVLPDGFPRKYRPSWKAAGLGLQVLGHNRVRDIAIRSVIDLAGEAGTGAFLSFTEGAETVFTDSVEVVGGRVMLAALYSRLPALVTASGRSALAHTPHAQVEAMLAAGEPLLAPYPATSLARVREEVDRARAVGYAVSHHEAAPDLISLVAAVLDASGRPVAAMGCSFHGSQTREELEDRYSEPIKQWARRASIELGYRAARLVG